MEHNSKDLVYGSPPALPLQKQSLFFSTPSKKRRQQITIKDKTTERKWKMFWGKPVRSQRSLNQWKKRLIGAFEDGEHRPTFSPLAESKITPIIFRIFLLDPVVVSRSFWNPEFYLNTNCLTSVALDPSILSSNSESLHSILLQDSSHIFLCR